MDADQRHDIEAFVKENRDNIIRDIGTIVAVPSVRGEAEEGAPYGAECRRVLDVMLGMAEDMGMETGVCDDRVGWAQLRGESGDKHLATVTHLDVVPAGKGWESDPFTLVEKDDYILGRGVLDDKGPSVLCLYALKYLKERNIPLRYSVRALFGTAEETGMEDVEYYLRNEDPPLFAFSPDSDFPVCNGEKGIYQGKLKAVHPSSVILDFKGGVVSNAVPDRAEAVLRCSIEELQPRDNIRLEEDAGCVKVKAYGIAGHASMPEGTRNAIGVLANYLLDSRVLSESEESFLKVLRDLHEDYHGRELDLDVEDDRFGKLTIIGGTAGMEDGILWQTIDCRYPEEISSADITEKLMDAAGDDAILEVNNIEEPFYMEADSDPVQVCIRAYNDITGEDKEPFTIGGGTYARNFPYAVSFGPEHHDRPSPDFVGGIHSANEGVAIYDLLEALQIYILALLELQKLEY